MRFIVKKQSCGCCWQVTTDPPDWKVTKKQAEACADLLNKMEGNGETRVIPGTNIPDSGTPSY